MEKVPTGVAIQIILAISLILLGLYVSGPWYQGGPTTAIGVSLDSQITRFFTGGGYLASGVISLYGVRRHAKKWRRWGTFSMFLSYMFMTMLRLFTFGPFPVHWLMSLTLGLTAAVLFFRESPRVDEMDRIANG